MALWPMARKVAFFVGAAAVLVSAVEGVGGEDEALLKQLASIEQDFRRVKAQHETDLAQAESQRSVAIRRLNSPHLMANATSIEKVGQDEKIQKTVLEQLHKSSTISFMLLSAFLVMFMQAGLSMLEAGYCRAKNVQAIMLKHLSNLLVGTFCWWTLGWMFAFGDHHDPKSFGDTQGAFARGATFADDNGTFETSDYMAKWFFQWTASAVALSLATAGLAERSTLLGETVVTIVFASFIYPVVAHWTWGGGWLSAGDDWHMNKVGFVDMAGSGVIHLTAGVAALVFAALCGPRDNVDLDQKTHAPHSVPLVVFGSFAVWFGFYGLSSGSVMFFELQNPTLVREHGQLAATAAMNMTVAAVGGGLVVLLFRLVYAGGYDVAGICQGLIAGLVAMSAGCANVQIWWAFLVGVLAGVFYQVTTMLLRGRIDDPAEIFAKHGVCGLWGVFAAAVFDWGNNFDTSHGMLGWDCRREATGVCVEDGYRRALEANVVFIVVAILWSGVLSAIVGFGLKALGQLSLDPKAQLMGADYNSHVASKAYNLGPLRSSTKGASGIGF